MTVHTTAAVRYWNAISPHYLELFRGELAEKPGDVAQLKAFAASLPEDGTVGDLGCGPCAHITQMLADAGLRVTGIDISEVAISLARGEHPGLDLQVMDASAISLARENRIPIIVFDIHKPGAFAATMRGEGTFTIIRDEG